MNNMNNISYFDQFSKKGDLSGESIQKRKRKRFETEFQNLTMQMIPLMIKYFNKQIAQVILRNISKFKKTGSKSS